MKKLMACKGSFYPANNHELENLINSFEKVDGLAISRAIIIPHAGYIYSGNLASKGIQHLKKDVKNIFIFAPAHYERLFGCVICDYNSFETPFGEIEVNNELSNEVARLCECHVNNFAFEKEHAIEVQLPLIKKLLPHAKIVPVLYGCENFKNLTDIIRQFYADKDNAFIISSDLSHYYPEKEAYRIDNYTAKIIEAGEINDFENEQACGAVGICGLVEFAKENNYSLIRVGITNSASVTGNSARVVGYGSWMLYEGDKNEYTKKYYSDFVIKICKNSILSGLQLGEIKECNYDCVFEQLGASFVTLELGGMLRGCIGSVMEHRPLIQDLIKNAHAAAFSDPRFPRLTLSEYNNLDIKVSLLSKPTRIKFDTEIELLDKLIPFQDGLIIRDGGAKGVFLPDVWEQLPDKQDFLKHLKIKAGLNSFSENLEAFKFHTIKI